MQKPTLQTILISILIIVALFTSIYFPYKWKQLSNDFLDQTNQYGELLNQISDLQKEVRELRNGEGKIDELPDENSEAEEKDEPKEISDWKTHRNEEFGFEFKYYQDIVLYENDNYKASLDKTLFQFDNITVNRFEKKENQTFENIIINNSDLPCGGPGHPNFSAFELKKIGNNSFYFRSCCFDTRRNNKGENICEMTFFYWLVKGNEIYEFNLQTDEISDLEKTWYSIDPLLIEKILSTFKFIE